MAHRTTMLGQGLKVMSRAHIEALAKGHGTGRPRRGRRRWSQCGARVCAPRAGRHSVRDGADSLASQANALAPLGLRPPKRSTLAAAHARRPVARYHALVATLDARCRAVAPQHRFRFKNPRFSLHSSTISRCLRLFPWACFRTTTGAMQVPTRLDQAGHVPAVVVRTEGQRRDLAAARGLPLPMDRSVTMDRGDIDAQVLFRLHQQGGYFVTRQQVNAPVKGTARFAVERSTGVTADHAVVLTGPQGRAYPARLRQVRYRDAATGQRSVLWTPAFPLVATTIAAIDQPRWQIALFWKTIQQNLRSTTFLGTSENAVMTQVGVALSTSLILAFLRSKARLGISFQQRLRLLPINRCERRNLLDLGTL